MTLIGIDGAEWQAINYLREQGELPTLDRFIKEGAHAKLESIDPTFTPIVWTTVATGMPPIRHGIRGFKLLNPETGHKVPVNRTMRKSPAIWNMLSSRGLQSLVTAWYATWPAEPVKGAVISDYTWPLKNTKLSEDFYQSQAGLQMRDQTYPRNLYNRVRQHFIDKFKENRAFEKRFGLAVKDSPYALKHGYAKDLTYFRIFRDMRQKQRFDLSTLYIQGPDLLSHKYWREFDLLTKGRADSKEQGKAELIRRYYKFIDKILAVYDRTIRRPGETVVIISDHGFEARSKPILTKVSDDKFDMRQYWHRNQGILIAHGPNVKRGARIPVATVFDIAPTVLTHFRLPVAKDMQGKPLAEIVGTLPKKLPTIASYDNPQKRTNAVKIRESTYDKEIIKSLNELGYIQ